MHIGICDDEDIFRTHLRKLLMRDSFAAESDIRVTEYASGEELLDAFGGENFRMDVLFLDIRMPGMDGLETARLLREKGAGCLIIFLTSLSEYARKGYEFRAFRYLLKEEAKRELGQVMADCRRELSGAEYFTFSQGHRNFSIRKGEILYFESQKRLVILHTARESHSFYQKLDALEELLAGDAFLRCHRSFLVQERYVKSWSENALWLEDGTQLPISRTYEREVSHRLMLRKGQW